MLMRPQRRDEDQFLNCSELFAGVEFAKGGEKRFDVLDKAVALGAFELDEDLFLERVSNDHLDMGKSKLTNDIIAILVLHHEV